MTGPDFHRRQILAMLPFAAGPSYGFASTRPRRVQARTTQGPVIGADIGGALRFLGVPYAGPVSGANRFRPAPPLEPWTEPRDATRSGPVAIQAPLPQLLEWPVAQSEDCLILNIWTPALDGRRRPVMVYNHGGGFDRGLGHSFITDGANLARRHDVVVVSTNHRLGLMGYLYLGDLAGEAYPGNQGLTDIVAALRWISANIAGFGGDPDNVMLFGESGGGWKTCALLTMPDAAPLFHKASIESGARARMMARADATDTTLAVLNALRLEGKDWRRLIDLPAAALLEAQQAVLSAGSASGARLDFAPVVDGALLPRHPFDPDAPPIARDKALIVGTNKDEAIYFMKNAGDLEGFALSDAAMRARLAQEAGRANIDDVIAAYARARPNASPTDLYIAITSDAQFLRSAVVAAERKAAQGGAPVFMYEFVHQSPMIVPGTTHGYGAAHASEIPYKFDNVPIPPAAVEKIRPVGPELDRRVGRAPDAALTARHMSRLWTSFARDGRPAAAGRPAWPAFDPSRRSTYRIDAQCSVADDPYRIERLAWAQSSAPLF